MNLSTLLMPVFGFFSSNDAPYIPLFVSPEMQNWKRVYTFVEANHHTAASLMAPINARVAFEALAALIIFPAFFASATEFIVGDDSGWSIDVDYEAWAEGKTFYVGDVLVFNYEAGYHSVVKVNGTGFAQCTLSPNNGVLTSGSDLISLATPGNKWYICGVANHCSYYSQKLKITVLPKDDCLPPSPSPAASEVSPAPAPWTSPVENQPEKGGYYSAPAPASMATPRKWGAPAPAPWSAPVETQPKNGDNYYSPPAPAPWSSATPAPWAPVPASMSPMPAPWAAPSKGDADEAEAPWAVPVWPPASGSYYTAPAPAWWPPAQEAPPAEAPYY